MVKQRIGYDEYQEKLSEERQAEEAKQQKRKKEKAEAQKKKEKEELESAAEKLRNKKLRKILGRTVDFKDFLKLFLVSQMVTFAVGNMAYFIAGDYDYGDDGLDFYHNSAGGRKISYWQAFKEAYGLDSEARSAKVYYVTLIVSCIVFVMGGYAMVSDGKDDRLYTLRTLEQLKDYGVNVKQLLADMGSQTNKIISSLSKLDRGYFDNLARGGLNKADYETCIAIVEGYLKSHPKEYEEIIKVIDEAVLPESIKKKYGKGKVVSFGGAQALSQIKR